MWLCKISSYSIKERKSWMLLFRTCLLPVSKSILLSWLHMTNRMMIFSFFNYFRTVVIHENLLSSCNNGEKRCTQRCYQDDTRDETILLVPHWRSQCLTLFGDSMGPHPGPSTVHPLPSPPTWAVSWLAARAAQLMSAPGPCLLWRSGQLAYTWTTSALARRQEALDTEVELTPSSINSSSGRELNSHNHKDWTIFWFRNWRLSTSSVFWQVAILD